VESHKTALFALIGPGFEEKAGKVEERLKKMQRIRVHAA
jgi:hypothetical protein